MNRPLPWLALAASVLLPAAASAQRCPFSMQSQVQLQIRVAEVSSELADIFRKLGLRSRTELALLAPDAAAPAREEEARDG